MSMLIRVKEQHTVRGDPKQEQPYFKFRTTGIFLVPDDYDYAAQCNDTTNVVIIAENVPEDVDLGLRGLPMQKKMLKDEGELSDIILQNANLLTCFNCGRTLDDVHSQHKGRAEDVGVLCIDPGSNNYPHEPDEPAQAYFECMECREANDRKAERRYNLLTRGQDTES